MCLPSSPQPRDNLPQRPKTRRHKKVDCGHFPTIHQELKSNRPYAWSGEPGISPSDERISSVVIAAANNNRPPFINSRLETEEFTS